MLGRIFGMLLGLALGGVGYAILNPGGLEGRIPPIYLGPFESLKLFVAAVAAGLGLIIFIAALLPKPKRKKGPMMADFGAVEDHEDTVHHAKPTSGSGGPKPSPLW